MRWDKITLERTRKQNAGYWATIRDGDDTALFFLAVRGKNTKYSRAEVGEILNELVKAIKEDRIELKDVVK